MSVDAILPGASFALTSFPVAPNDGVQAAKGPDFSRWLTQELEAVNERINSAGQSLERLAAGEATNLHEVMLDLEKARLAFQLTLQVRNKLLEGYQDIMRMQI